MACARWMFLLLAVACDDTGSIARSGPQDASASDTVTEWSCEVCTSYGCVAGRSFAARDSAIAAARHAQCPDAWFVDHECTQEERVPGRASKYCRVCTRSAECGEGWGGTEDDARRRGRFMLCGRLLQDAEPGSCRTHAVPRVLVEIVGAMQPH